MNVWPVIAPPQCPHFKIPERRYHVRAGKIAKATKNTKVDDEFVAQVDKIIKALGWSVKPHEVEAIKALGSGHHQDVKAADKDADALGKLLVLGESSDELEKPEA